jgi:alpha-glucosidase
MVRPIAWGEGEPTELWDVEDEFLCGDAMLVAPILERGASIRTATLPAGGWYDYWSNAYHKGSQDVRTYAPLEITPLFVRAGAVLAMGESAINVEQRIQRFLRLRIYVPAGPGVTTSELYEDVGDGPASELRSHRLSSFELDRDGDLLTLIWNTVGAYVPPYEHIEVTLCGVQTTPRGVVAGGLHYPIVRVDRPRRSAVFAVPPFRTLRVQL